MYKSVNKSSRMKSTITYAQIAEHIGKHDFGLSDYAGMTNKTTASPKLSKAGQYYLDCRKCKRSIFENGTGSAASSTCG